VTPPLPFLEVAVIFDRKVHSDSLDHGGSKEMVPNRVRWAFYVSSALVVAFLVSLIVRSTGSYFTPVDGWGVDLFELTMGAICVRRYFDKSWRSSHSAASVFPLVLGGAAILWALGDVANTIESLGGVTPPVPSVANGFWLGFFPLAYISFMLVIRRGNEQSLIATSLDGVIAGLGVACLSAAFLFDAVLRATDGGNLSTATNMAYPVGDVLLFALAVGALAVLPKQYRRFFGIASIAMAVNAVGDMFNLLQPSSKMGYIANAVVWPISLLMLAIATWVQPAITEKVGTEKAINAEKVSTEKTAGFVLPGLGALAGMAVLLTACIDHVGKPAIALATATLFVAGIRLTLTVRESQALNSARFRSMIDNAWDLIVVAEADFGIAYITPSSERVLGYAPQDLQGRPLTEIAHPDDAQVVVTQLDQLADGSTETAAFEIRMRHRNGAWRTIAWTATNLLADPSVRGYVLNGGDVTEARQAAEDLAAARDGALMASKAKSDFLSTMSHEIRTPMNGVIGLTELLLGTRLDREQQELASGVKVSAENLLVIINDILDFSKIEAGKLDIEEVAFNVAGVADDVGRMLAATANAKGIELLIDVHPDVPTELLGDGVRVQQVLLNLGSNAVKFTSEGEVIIRVSVLDGTTERVALRFDVIDQGIGIADSDQERLFRPFAQADSSTTRKFGGTGLGLAICRQLVELMGGRLGLVSAPGEGSTFWFELSLQRADREPSPEPSEPRYLEGKRALIVDDNATNRKILRQQLLSWGVEAVEAVDGFQALELVADVDQTFDIGVIDLNMPGMDGLELASMLKARPSAASMLLFLLSSSGDRLGAAESHLRGFAGSLTKPVRSSELFDCLITGLNDGVSTPQPEPTIAQSENVEVLGVILLVEDNKMNQLVGSKVLAKLGFAFDIANHGGEAISAVQARRYDAILMDCQMPEMDGYEATAEIRCMEGNARRTPIIAMTAAAMEGDRDTCLAAGMDDYITKPVRLETVAAVLERWVSPSMPEDPGEKDATISPEDGEPDPLDQSQIELLRSLDDGEGAVLGEIIEQYLAQTAEGRGELARVVGEGDTCALERAAHTIRGASANVGASALAAVCAEIELRGRSAQLEGAAELVERFDVEFARVNDALNRLLTPTA
jgi:PAS domain S-box-containing protein